MRYAQAKDLPAKEFKRLFGVQPRTFREMVETMRHHRQLKKTSGAPKLSRPLAEIIEQA